MQVCASPEQVTMTDETLIVIWSSEDEHVIISVENEMSGCLNCLKKKGELAVWTV